MEDIGSIDHTINQIAMGHPYLRCRNLPENIKKSVRDNLSKTFVKYKSNLNIAGNIKRCLLELDEAGSSEQYKSYFDRIDSLQGTNWRKLYPELT